MNRLIKFRVWDGQNKRWFSQEILKVLPLDVFLASENIQQFTGLFDKNGKEIYEGDLVYSHFNHTTNIVEWGNYQIYKNDDAEKSECIGYFLRGIKSNFIEEFDSSNWAMIVGNIFENPELLKQ